MVERCPRPERKLMRVLIIDDEEDVRRIAYLSLVNVGKMDVEQASSATEGLEKALVFQPDVILLDVMMPEMDGPATLAKLKSDERTATIPVIFVTARAMKTEIETFLELGAKGVLTKPFSAMTLPDEVRKALE
jgi:CheY-like chemotaxis protein